MEVLFAIIAVPVLIGLVVAGIVLALGLVVLAVVGGVVVVAFSVHWILGVLALLGALLLLAAVSSGDGDIIMW